MSLKEEVIIVICTRLDSIRFPGKAIKPICGTKALDHLLNRIEASGLKTCLAVPKGQAEAFSSFLHFREDWLSLVEGNPESPLHRSLEALTYFVPTPKYFVRITHDDILIDTISLMEMLEETIKRKVGYAYSPDIMAGAGVEIISTENLAYACKARQEPAEFLSYFVKGTNCPNPAIYKYQPRKSICRPFNLCIDYKEDSILIEAVLRAIGKNATVDQICYYLDTHPYLLNINKQPELSIYTCAYNAE